MTQQNQFTASPSLQKKWQKRRQKIVEMREKGFSYREIADKFQISRQMAWKLYNKEVG